MRSIDKIDPNLIVSNIYLKKICNIHYMEQVTAAQAYRQTSEANRETNKKAVYKDIMDNIKSATEKGVYSCTYTHRYIKTPEVGTASSICRNDIISLADNLSTLGYTVRLTFTQNDNMECVTINICWENATVYTVPAF